MGSVSIQAYYFCVLGFLCNPYSCWAFGLWEWHSKRECFWGICSDKLWWSW